LYNKQQVSKGNHGSQNSQLITTNFKEQILTASWIPAAVKFATTVAGSRDGSRRRRPGGLGTAAAGMAGLAAGAAATAAAVLLAAANSALTRSAIADSLSPIFSICSKNITGLFRSRKTLKNAVEKHCVHGSQKFAVCGRKNLHKYLRILRYDNWWIFLDSILKINPRNRL
jgi:hypothetical protein